MPKNTFPDDLPGRKQLEAAGVSVARARGMSEQELTEIDGIGPKTAAEIVAFDWEGETQAPASKGQESADGSGASVKSVQDKTGFTNVIR